MPENLVVQRELSSRRSEPALKRETPAWLLAFLLGIATACVYLPTLRNGFIQFDDPGYVTANRYVRAGLNWRGVVWAFHTLQMGHWHPLAWISHMLDCQLFGLNPAGHHASAILLHALNAVLVFLLLQAGTGLRWRSLFVAALFAVHPLNVESVSWIAERKSLLSMFFSLITIGLYGWYARAPRWGRYLAVIAGFLLALMAKPMAVTLPIVLLLLDYWPLGRFSVAQRQSRFHLAWKLILEKAPMLLIASIISWLAVVSQDRSGTLRSIAEVPLKYRIANVMVALVTYMRRMIWPNDLAYFYPLQHPLPHWKVWIAGLVLTAITLLVYFRRQRPALVFGCFFFVITILPVIGIVQLGRQSMADRYAYIPLIGLFIAITWEAADIAGRRNIPPFAQACVAVLILGLFANCTRITESYWRNDLALFQRAHDAVRPANIEIETNLGAALNDVGRYAEALTYFRNAESIDPKSFTAHYNCGYDLAQLRDDAAAAVEFQEALRYAPLPELKVRALNSLGIAYLNQGRGQQAASTFSELLAIEPQNARAAALRTEALEMAGKSGQAAKR